MRTSRRSRSRRLWFTCYRSITLLTSGVPYLQFNAFVVSKYGLNLKVDANGADERGREGIVGISKELRRRGEKKNRRDVNFLRDGRLKSICHTNDVFPTEEISDDEQFEHVIEILISCIFRCSTGTVLCHLKMEKSSVLNRSRATSRKNPGRFNRQIQGQAIELSQDDDCCRWWRRYLCVSRSRRSFPSFFSLPTLAVDNLIGCGFDSSNYKIPMQFDNLVFPSSRETWSSVTGFSSAR